MSLKLRHTLRRASESGGGMRESRETKRTGATVPLKKAPGHITRLMPWLQTAVAMTRFFRHLQGAPTNDRGSLSVSGTAQNPSGYAPVLPPNITFHHGHPGFQDHCLTSPRLFTPFRNQVCHRGLLHNSLGPVVSLCLYLCRWVGGWMCIHCCGRRWNGRH
jgi:hypothetical protein